MLKTVEVQLRGAYCVCFHTKLMYAGGMRVPQIDLIVAVLAQHACILEELFHRHIPGRGVGVLPWGGRPARWGFK